MLSALLASAVLFGSPALAEEPASNVKDDVVATPITTPAAPAAAPVRPKKVSIKKCSVRMVKSLNFSGLYLCPEPKVRYRGKMLVKGVDYKLSYKANRGIGQGVVIIKGKGNFKKSIKKKFKIKYSNAAIAFAACRLSYSKARTNGHAVSRSNGYLGTSLYQKYTTTRSFSCSRIVRMTIARYLRVDTKFPGDSGRERSYMLRSSKWKRVCYYRAGMENDANSKLRPGDVYNNGHHTCIFVGNEIPAIVYKDYLKEKTGKKRSKLGKKLADLGKPSKNAVWVSSHKIYMGGSAAHICTRGDSLAHSGGYIYRYIGNGSKDPKKATK